MLSGCVLRGRVEETQKEQVVIPRTMWSLHNFPKDVVLLLPSLVLKRGASHDNELPQKAGSSALGSVSA